MVMMCAQHIVATIGNNVAFMAKALIVDGEKVIRLYRQPDRAIFGNKGPYI